MRCIDCHWFENPHPAGREPQSCAALGELAQSPACDRFRILSRDEESDVPIELGLKGDAALETLGALANQRYSVVFQEVLAESFALEQDAEFALKTVKAQLQTQGAMVDAPGEEYKRTVAKLVDLYVTYRLANAVGLGAFAAEILSREIERRFGQRQSGDT